ncbi:MAG: helix-hairpin-helix domain-containing protein [Rhodospirillales bacterium]|nr:helix-hairpin-helix domain-containing protein [Rhodospirillales bacterium]
MLKQLLNNYFGFNRQQRNGLYVLCCISVCLLVVRIVYPYFLKPAPIHIGNLAMVEANIEDNDRKNNLEQSLLFPFDPNTVSKEQLVKLGFKERTAQTFIKFRSKGFVFKKKEDVQKIFGVSEALYMRIEPYILFNRSDKKETSNYIVSKESKAKKLELNSADSLSLIALDGVGPGYAKRILKYRRLLGGFVKIEQLKEIYGMSDDLFQLIASQCIIDPSVIKKININSADFKTLNKHPYIDYELTKHIFNFKKTTAVTEANLIQIIEDEELTSRIKPYLEY